MEVKPGYKQTEVGVIPEEWDVKPLFSLSTEIGDGIHSTPNYVKSSEFHFVNGNNLVNDRISITDSTMCVSEAEYKTLRKNLTDRTLLLSINGTIGNLAFYNGERVILGKSAAYISVGKAVSRRFISYCLKSRPTSLFFDNELTGTTIRNLSLQSLRNTPVPMPPTIDEQCAIAGALSDVDALLGALDRLIAKKRDLKQAAMQQLLTGQTRLPGFHGEWEVKRLGDVVEKLVGGGTPSRSDPAFWGNEVPWVTVKDFATFQPRQTQESITRIGLKNSASHLIPAGTLITSTRMALGKAVIYEVDVAINQDLKAVFLKPSSSVEFLYYWFEHNAQMIDELGSGSTVKGISIAELKGLPFPLLSVPEQTAIAEVLTDMDAELAALEQRRDKTRALKQGMMQELLTGMTRLI
jgi:type I restriction enzyme S subunit